VRGVYDLGSRDWDDFNEEPPSTHAEREVRDCLETKYNPMGVVFEAHSLGLRVLGIRCSLGHRGCLRDVSYVTRSPHQLGQS